MVDLSSKETIEKATVNDLKQELKNAGLTQGGVKADLVERLWTWAQEQKQQGAQEQGQQGPPQEKQQAAPEQQPAAAPVETPAAQPAPAPSNPDPATQQQADGQAQQPAGQSKHTKIVFDDSAAAQMEAKKLEVLKPAKPAEEVAPEPKPVSALTEAEKAKLRADKFKDPEAERKKIRAERFNIASPELESERARKRAERFGINHPDIEAEKSRKRKERFGVEDPEAKMQARADRFKPLETPKPAPDFGVVLSREELKARKERQARFQGSS